MPVYPGALGVHRRLNMLFPQPAAYRPGSG